MKKSELKQLIREVINEVSSQVFTRSEIHELIRFKFRQVEPNHFTKKNAFGNYMSIWKAGTGHFLVIPGLEYDSGNAEEENELKIAISTVNQKL